MEWVCELFFPRGIPHNFYSPFGMSNHIIYQYYNIMH